MCVRDFINFGVTVIILLLIVDCAGTVVQAWFVAFCNRLRCITSTEWKVSMSY